MGVIRNHDLIEDLNSHCDTVTEAEYREIAGLFPKYIFYQKERGHVELWAGCCGRNEAYQTTGRIREAVPLELHHGRKEVCPWCGASVPVLNWNRFPTGTTLIRNKCVVALRADGGYLYAAAFHCRVEYLPMYLHRPLRVQTLQMYRFAPGEALEIDTQRADMENQPWIYQERGELRCGRKYVQEPFLKGNICSYGHEGYNVIGENALDASPFRYCGYFTHWQQERGYCKDLISYLTAFALYPRQIEMLSKTGVRSPVERLMRDHGKSGPLIDFYADNPYSAFGLDRSGLRDFLKNSRDIRVLPAYRQLMAAGIRVSFTRLNWMYHHLGETWLHRTVRRLCQMGIRPEKVERYLNREKEQSREQADDTVWYSWWLDYLDAADALGMDLGSELIRFPRNLPAKHDEYTKTLAAVNEIKARKAAREIECLRMRKVNRQYLFWDHRYLIRAPVSASEIVEEGKSLKHCVGGYAERHITGRVVILFLRDKRRPGTPLVTIEMSGTEIVQIHGYKNELCPCSENPQCASPMEIYRDFLNEWLSWLRNGSRRDREGRPKRPAKT